ncbi:MAG: hypothetical protein R3F29_07355 [Planctomycetota bacterium]
MNRRIALLLALQAALSTTGIRAQLWGGETYTEPDLSKITLPILERAKEHPEELWQFLTDPATPFDQALAAADRCGTVFPLDQVRTLLMARQELAEQWIENGCGIAPHPLSSPPVPPPPPLGSRPGPPRERLILGRAWTPPKHREPYPSTWEQAEEAPWPWRVNQVVRRTWTAVARPMGYGGADGEKWWRQVRPWFLECNRWPLATDADAQLYFEATSVPWQGKPTAVLARWRRILLDPNMPQAAARVANALGNVQSQLLHGDDDARLACRVLLVDGLTLGPHLRVRQNCAYQLPKFRTRYDSRMKAQPAACPAAAMLAVGDNGAAKRSQELGGEWNQLYVFAFSLCEALDAPPIAVERSVVDDRQDVPGKLAAFAAWWQEQRPTYVAAAAADEAELQRMRKRLEQLAR